MSDRLPTALYVEAHLKVLTDRGIYYYFIQKGNHGSGLILLKLNGLQGEVRLLIQQRNFETDALEWAAALDKETVKEPAADDYIARAKNRDPDLWIIEIEDAAMGNPLE